MSREVPVELTNMCMICDGSRVLVQNRRDKGWPGITFPGGHVEPGESITDSVVREVFEETGLSIACPRLCGVKNWANKDGSRYMVFFYKTSDFSGELKSSEEGEVFWAERASLPCMNLSNGIEETFQTFFNDDISELFYTQEDGGDWRYILY